MKKHLKILRRSAFLMLSLIAVFSPGRALRAESPDKLEYRVKAAFLERFLGFIEYEGSSGSITEQNNSLEICIYGADSIMHALQELNQVPRESATKAVYRSMANGRDLEHCCLVYIGAASGMASKEILEQLTSTKTITVSDIPGFAANGGMIELVKDEDHVRFIINRLVAKAQGIKFSAQLLSLAKEVIDK